MISVILPVYNGLNFLNDSIRSVLDQSFSDYEIIVVDDASTENIFLFLSGQFAKFLETDKIRYFRNDTRLERCLSRNRGVSLSHGEIVSLLDHDDCYKPNYLSQVNEMFTHDPDLDFLYSAPSELINHKNQVIGKFACHIDKNDLFKTALSASMIGSGMSFKKQSFLRIGGYDPEAVRREDYEISCRAICGYHLKTKILLSNAVQIRRIKSEENPVSDYSPLDLYLLNTKKSVDIISQFHFFKDKRNCMKYMPYLLVEAIETAITFNDHGYAFDLFCRSFLLNPFHLSNWLVLPRLLFRKIRFLLSKK